MSHNLPHHLPAELSKNYRTVQNAAAFGAQYCRFPADRLTQVAAMTIDLIRFPLRESEDLVGVFSALQQAFALERGVPPYDVAEQTPRYAAGAASCSRIVSLSANPGCRNGQTVQVPELIQFVRRPVWEDQGSITPGRLVGTYAARFTEPGPDRFLFFRIGDEKELRVLTDSQRRITIENLGQAATAFSEYAEVSGADFPQYYLGFPDSVAANLYSDTAYDLVGDIVQPGNS
ncbi:MAG TPA: hypothetical protein VGS08_04125 [Candidatus Saccharimonadales bacterium]|nr:hypothetical protein [Candidatus Saccharimonadales bacterium]